LIKVMWFLKRADHLTLDEFRDWWVNRHAHDIRADQAPYLDRYVVNVRENEDVLTGRPAAETGKPAEEPDWDGVAEQWFADAAAFDAVYGRTDRPTREDTLAHTSRWNRLVVREWEY
jgi:hypothetical protein